MVQPAEQLAGPSIETLETMLDVTYTWGYQETREKLRDLYDKAVRAQWIADDVLPWHTNVDLERPFGPEQLLPLWGSDLYNRLSAREKKALDIETFSWTLSQFMHGEQGALLAAAQLVDSVQDLDSKLYSASQVVDEARHVDVYNRYVHKKIGFSYPVNPHLKTLLDMILKDSRWDMKFLGMQIMVEGLALAAFALIRNNTNEPLLRELTAYVMGDEARHVAFGVLSLRDYYRDQPESVNARARGLRLRGRAADARPLPVPGSVGEAGPAGEGVHGHRAPQPGSGDVPADAVREDRARDQEDGFADDRQRQRFAELGILQFETWVEPFTEAEQSPKGAVSARF